MKVTASQTPQPFDGQTVDKKCIVDIHRGKNRVIFTLWAKRRRKVLWTMDSGEAVNKRRRHQAKARRRMERLYIQWICRWRHTHMADHKWQHLRNIAIQYGWWP